MQPYTYYSGIHDKTMDATGIVHDLVDAPEGLSYRKRTACESAMWHLIEPLCVVPPSVLTTCLQCLGAKRG